MNTLEVEHANVYLELEIGTLEKLDEDSYNLIGDDGSMGQLLKRHGNWELRAFDAHHRDTLDIIIPDKKVQELIENTEVVE